jgi:hypothetical protein
MADTSPFETAALPQYLYSEDIGERFRTAVLASSGAIARAKWSEDVKVIEDSEKAADAFAYFIENKAALEQEFLSDLIRQIDEEAARQFVTVISNNWHFDPHSHPAQRLKASVRRYLQYLGESAEKVDTLVRGPRRTLPTPSFSPLEIELILDTTHQMLFKHIEAWNSVRPESWRHSRGTVFLRRGIALEKPFSPGDRYQEWDFINAYSLTVSVPEKFSLPQIDRPIPAIVTADIDYLNHCILFFSPFIPNMPADQLEAGVIPGFRSEHMAFHGKHGGIYEYYLAPHERPADVSAGANRGRTSHRPRHRNPSMLAPDSEGS